jgi:hypothetical protein
LTRRGTTVLVLLLSAALTVVLGLCPLQDGAAGGAAQASVTGTHAAYDSDRHSDHPGETPAAPVSVHVRAIAAEIRFVQAAPALTLPRAANSLPDASHPGRIEAHLHRVCRQVTGDTSALLQVFRC